MSIPFSLNDFLNISRKTDPMLFFSAIIFAGLYCAASYVTYSMVLIESLSLKCLISSTCILFVIMLIDVSS